MNIALMRQEIAALETATFEVEEVADLATAYASAEVPIGDGGDVGYATSSSTSCSSCCSSSTSSCCSSSCSTSSCAE